VHDYHADLELVLRYGEQLNASSFDHSLGIGNSLSELQEGDFVAIPLNHHEFPSDAIFAIPHNKRNRKNG
jgi:hypothetical protein